MAWSHAPVKLNPQNVEDSLSTKIEPLENFLLYGAMIMAENFMGEIFAKPQVLCTARKFRQI